VLLKANSFKEESKMADEENVIGGEIDNFDVFEDRVLSLLKRWRNFKDNHPKIKPKIKNVADRAVSGALYEISDGFSKSLGEDADAPDWE
jgi:hypothetical protein